MEGVHSEVMVTQLRGRRDSISIALATYNGAAYLQEQLSSFSHQTILPDELVVCDDCSTDSTVDILNEFKTSAPFEVRIYRNATNLGYIRNFERAMSFCTGEVVFLSDQDDYWFHDKIEQVLALFESHPDVMVVLNDQIISDGNLSPSKATKLTNIIEFGYSKSIFVAGCCSAHRRAWQAIALPIPAGALAHDDWINGLAHRLGVSLISPIPLQLYRRHQSNVSNSLMSSTKRLRRFDRIIRFNPMHAQEGWRRTLAYDSAVAARVSSKTALLQAHGLGEAGAKLEKMLKGKVEAYDARLTIYELSKFKRIISIIRLWRLGGYHYFGNWRSALKDVLWTL